MNTLNATFARLLRAGICVSLVLVAGCVMLAERDHVVWMIPAAFFMLTSAALIVMEVRRDEVLNHMVQAVAESLPKPPECSNPMADVPPLSAEEMARIDALVRDALKPRVRSVTYRRLKSFGNYENEAVEATVAVPPGGSADESLAFARDWVNHKLSQRDEYEKMADQIALMRSDLAKDERKLIEVQAKYERYKSVLEKHGVAVEDPNEPPF